MAMTAVSASAKMAAPSLGVAAVQNSSFRKPFTGVTGLRAISRTSRSFSVSPSTGAAKRRQSIVCEATETATVGLVTDATFKSLVLDSDVPVLIDFWAPWCGPCRMIEPIITEIAGQYGAKLKVFKLNTDESPGIATEYGIRSIPTVMVFKRGKKVDTVIGAVPKSTLTSTIDKYL